MVDNKTGEPASTQAAVVDPQRRRRSRIMLIVLALLFMGPLAGSWLYHLGGGDWRPAPDSHGTLVESALDLRTFDLRAIGKQPAGAIRLAGYWTLLYPGGTVCGETCAAILYDLRQVRLALGKDTDRVQRVYLAASDTEPSGVDRGLHADLVIAFSAPMRAAISEQVMDSGRSGRFLLVDPGGRPVTVYPADFEKRGLLDDIEHLLNFSIQ